MLQIFEGVALVGALVLYLVPAIEADVQRHDDAFAITLVNVLLGWTVIGWFAALAWTRRPASEKRLPHLARRTQRAIARATIDKLVAHAGKRAVLQTRSAGIHPVLPGAWL